MDSKVEAEAKTPSNRGRLEPEMWSGVEDTDPAMVIDVERGARIEDVPPAGLVP